MEDKQLKQEVAELTQLFSENDELLMSSNFEDVCFSDYTTVISGLDDVIDTFNSQKILRYDGEPKDDGTWEKDTYYSEGAKKTVLAHYLRKVADNLEADV